MKNVNIGKMNKTADFSLETQGNTFKELGKANRVSHTIEQYAANMNYVITDF